MSYTVKSSERHRKSGSDSETKAMLYLMNFREDSSQMHYFVVDFFNDITGMDRMARNLWDVQSKASISGTAKTIGRELVTLYKNYVSSMPFVSYVIFLGGVPETFRVDSSSFSFDSKNITEKAKKSIRDGLVAECMAKEYINNSDVTDERIDDFLGKVWYVIDDKKPEEYVRKIIEQHSSIIPSENDLLIIFNEIRNKQSEKKNSVVECVVIDNADEVLCYGRHLSTNEIRLLVLQRILHTDPLSSGIPSTFLDTVLKYPPEGVKEMVENCQKSLCSALFNKSAVQGFWKLFDSVYYQLKHYPDMSIGWIYSQLDSDIIEQCPDFDALSLKYFIAITKEGIAK